MKTFCVKTLGCKVNSYESDFIRSLFLSKEYKEVEENADVYVVNTCTVTNNSDKKSQKIIKSIRRNYPKSILIVAGCFIQYLKDKSNELIDADIILGNQDKNKIIDYLEEYIKNKNKISIIKDIDTSFEHMEIHESNNHARAFVKIQDGCNNFCSYCIIPFVRGRVRSKDKISSLREIEELVKNNHKEIVLTGIHTGQYGIDLEDYNLASLVNDTCKIDGLERLRISSIEVVEITNELLNSLRINKKLVSHFHIPLQSGSDKILKLMNRRYDKKYFEEKIKGIRNIRPEVSITTDVIVGFPGETEEDFNETYDFCKHLKFSKIHVFPYSDRNGTVASNMKDKINGSVKKTRVNKLLELSKKLESEYYNLFLGKEVGVLIEEYRDGYFLGHTSNYLYLKVNGNFKINEIYQITLN